MDRDTYFDNAKAILIVLIVFGHSLESFLNFKVAKAVYYFLYLFHIPCFVLISGFFSKRISSINDIGKLFSRVLVPYIIFEFLYSVFDYLLFNRQGLVISFMTPYWLMWYMLSLFCWHFMMLLFRNLKCSIPLAVIVGVFSGYFVNIGYYFSLSRTLIFFPFFVTGYYLRNKHFDILSKRSYRFLAGLIMFVSLIIIYFNISMLDHRWLYGSFSYTMLNQYNWYAWIERLCVYSATFLLSFAFFSLVSGNKGIITSNGRRVIYAYLLHGFIIKYLAFNNFFNLIQTEIHLLVLLPISMLLALVLSSKFVSSGVKYVVHPKLKWIIYKG